MAENESMIAFTSGELPEEGRIDTVSESGHVIPYYFPPYTYKIVGSYLVIIGAIGAIGNLVVIAMFMRFRSLVSPTTLLLINLAFSDLGLILVGGFPFAASSGFANRWLFGEGGCQWYAFMGFLFGSAEVGTLVLLALDRYFITCRNSLRGKLTFRRYCQLLFVVWIYAFFWASMPLLGWGRYGLEPNITTCTIDWQHNDSAYKSFILVFVTLGFIVPWTVIGVCYYAAAKRMREKRSSIGSTRGPVYDQWENERSVTLMTFIVIMTFMVAWTPCAILCLWTVFDEPASVPPALILVSPLFAKLSTLFNPIIYFSTNRRMRTGMISTFLCTCRDTPPEILKLHDGPERIPTSDPDAI